MQILLNCNKKNTRWVPVTPAGGSTTLPSSPYLQNNCDSSWAVVFAGRFFTRMTVFDLLILDVVKASSEIPLSSRNLEWKNTLTMLHSFLKAKYIKLQFSNYDSQLWKWGCLSILTHSYFWDWFHFIKKKKVRVWLFYFFPILTLYSCLTPKFCIW